MCYQLYVLKYVNILNPPQPPGMESFDGLNPPPTITNAYQMLQIPNPKLEIPSMQLGTDLLFVCGLGVGRGSIMLYHGGKFGAGLDLRHLAN